MTEKIPLAKPEFNHMEISAVRRVLDSGWVVQGPEVKKFECLIAKLHSARHCIAVTSGTAALHISYLALGLKPGDAVPVRIDNIDEESRTITLNPADKEDTGDWKQFAGSKKDSIGTMESLFKEAMKKQ